MEFFEKALKIQTEMFGTANPDIAFTLCNIGDAYSESGKMAEAVDAYKKALDIRMKMLHANHVLIAENRLILADILEKGGDFKSAGQYCNAALPIIVKNFGANSERALELEKRISKLGGK